MFENILNNIEVIKREDMQVNPDDAIHCAFGIDHNYITFMGVLMTSIIYNNREEKIVFHIFLDSIDALDKIKLKRLSEQFNISVNIYYLNIDLFKPITPDVVIWSSAIFNRLVIPCLLDKRIERVLYLDSDTICDGSIKKFFNVDLKGNIVAAVQDSLDLAITTYRLGMDRDVYFNSGVLLIDLILWRAKHVSEIALQKLFENPEKYVFPDQDVLNIILEKNVLYVSRAYNSLDKSYKQSDDEKIIIHYTGEEKPWCSWCQHPEQSCYLKYYNQSLWSEIPIVLPRTYKEMRMEMNKCRNEKKYIKMFYWWFQFRIRQYRFKLIRKMKKWKIWIE